MQNLAPIKEDIMSSMPIALHNFASFVSDRDLVRSAGRCGSELDASAPIKRGALVFLSNELRTGWSTNSVLPNPVVRLRHQNLISNLRLVRLIDGTEGGR